VSEPSAREEPPAQAPALRRPPTIYDVAEVAGVSHQLVSRYLKGETGIRPANRDRVIAALAQLEYRPNMTARSLATSRPHRVAVLTHEIGQVGPGLIAQGASAEARRHGYLFDLVTLDFTDRAAIDDVLGALNQREIAGVLALASTDEVIEAFRQTVFHVPAFVAAEADEATGTVSSELNSIGFDQLVNRLYADGHRHFFHLGGPRTWVAARNRELAYHRALDRYGLTSAGTAYGDWSAASGYAAAAAVPTEATAVISANDQMAIGVMRGLLDLGRPVPEAVSVTGVDDIPEAEFVSPPLTTVRVDFEEQGRAAFRRLLAQIQGDQIIEPVQPAEVVIRRSTSVARV